MDATELNILFTAIQATICPETDNLCNQLTHSSHRWSTKAFGAIIPSVWNSLLHNYRSL